MTIVGIGAGMVIGFFIVGLLKARSVFKELMEGYNAPVFLTQSEMVSMIEQGATSKKEVSQEEDNNDAIKVAIVDGVAYWVADNAVYYAPVTDDEEVDFESRMVYNAIEADHHELLKLMFILDNLKKEK